jgi:hypothetical protein
MNLRTLATVAVAVLLVAAASPTGVAQSDDQWKSDLFDQFEANADLFNDNVDNVSLGVAGDQLANHRVNLYVNDGDDQLIVSFYMDGDNHITDLQMGAHEDASLKMTTDRETVTGILASQTPAGDFRSAVADDRIVIGGEQGHPVQQVKWTVINIVKPFFL